MGLFKTPVEAELAKVKKQERRYLEKREDKKDSIINQKLQEKVPPGMQEKLDMAFSKAFETIFQQGTGLIEKTYKRDNKELEFRAREMVADKTASRKALRAFSKAAGKTGVKNLAISGTAGIGMGVMGVGIPDIPVFTGMILKQVYETALNYGFHYDTVHERYFILKLIQGSVTYGDKLLEIDNEINRFMVEGNLPENADMKKEIEDTAGYLSKELLYMKFLQGIPLVGAVGGAFDAIYMKKVAEYSEMKYRRRFYEKMNRKVSY